MGLRPTEGKSLHCKFKGWAIVVRTVALFGCPPQSWGRARVRAPKKAPKGWATTAEARKITGLARARLSKLALEGKVDAHKSAGGWHFRIESLKDHIRRREKYLPKDYQRKVAR